MPDVKIKGWSGTEFSYADVPKIWLDAAQSTEEAPVLVPYTYGDAVSKTVDPDFSGGDMALDIPDGELVKELTITKPETLIPENITAGVTIAGILGTFAGGAGVLASTGTYQPEATGRITIPHGLGVVPDIVMVFRTSPAQSGKGFSYQYSMSEAFHNLSGSPDYGHSLYISGSVLNLGNCSLTSDSYAFVGAIGDANAESFKVGGSVFTHDVGETYTWLALAIK